MSDYDWSRHLQEDEELLWQGRPDKRFRLFMRGADIFIVPFFGLFLYAGLGGLVTTEQQPSLETGVDAPPQGNVRAILLVIGAYVVFGRATIDRIARRNLRYAITNRRVLRAHRRLGILNRIEINKDLKLAVLQGRFTTIRFNRAIEYGWPTIPFADPFGLNRVIFEAVLRGYVEPGPEFRAIKDGPNVSRLLKSLRSAATEGAA